MNEDYQSPTYHELSSLLYMIFKHAVDRYNIYFAYKRSRSSDQQFGESDGLTTPPETNEKPFIASVLLNRNSTDESVQVSTSSEPVGVQGKTNYGSVNEKHTHDPYEP